MENEEILSNIDYSQNSDYDKLKNTWYLILEKLKGKKEHYLLQYSSNVNNEELIEMETFLNGHKLPQEYTELLLHKGIIWLTVNDWEGISSINPENHIVENPKTGYKTNSFFPPNYAISLLTDLKEIVRDDYRNLKTLNLLERAIPFQQGDSDADYFLFVVNELDELVIMFFDGEGNGSLEEISKDFKSYIEFYVDTKIKK